MPAKTEISPVDTETRSLWTDPSAQTAPKSNHSNISETLPADSTHDDQADTDVERRKVAITNLAALAKSVIRQRKPENPAKYFAQVDMQSWTVRRSKFGKKRTDMYVVLDGVDLSITKSKRNADSKRPNQKLVINVSTDNVRVDIDRREMVVCRPGRERPLRLQIISEDTCIRWRDAVLAAQTCDIEQFYELGNLLGSGAYGQVFEAFDVRTRELRAAKIVCRSSSNPKSVEHLSREIDIMRSVEHPAIIRTYQIFDLKRKIYMVMEYVPGGDLFDFVAERDVLSEAQGSQLLETILGAVAYLHSRNIVHRDLKPENILCVQKCWPLKIKITDFGFSSVVDEDSVMRTSVGTAYFMAPEIMLHTGHGAPVDLWACGVILYTILTGRLPFPGRNRDEYLRNVVRREPLFPPSLWKGISPDARNLVKGLLNKDPQKRLTALGALNHKWISAAAQYAPDVGIKRNRSNLHSSRRRLYKARSSIIAVAMAEKFKATSVVDLFEKIPVVVDKVGEGTKKAAQKTADNVMDVSDRIGEGGKKVVKGVKKTGRKVENGAHKIGEGVKKTGDGIGRGAKKAAEGIGNGAKKTKESFGTGVKKTTEGFKKTGEGIKKGAVKVKIDRDLLDKLKPRFNGSQTGSHPGSSSSRRRDRESFFRRNRGETTDRSEGTRDIASDGSTDVRDFAPIEEVMDKSEAGEDVVASSGISTSARSIASETTGEYATPNLSSDSISFERIRGELDCSAEHVTKSRSIKDTLSSKTDFFAIAQQVASPSKVGSFLQNVLPNDSKSLVEFDDPASRSIDKTRGTAPDAIEKHSSDVSNGSSGCPQPADSSEKHTSNISNDSTGSGRPKLAPLSGLVGFPPICDIVGDSGGSSDDLEITDEDDSGANKLRKTAAMLLATSDCSNPRSADNKQNAAVAGSSMASASRNP